jgi:hypothetical protein
LATEVRERLSYQFLSAPHVPMDQPKLHVCRACHLAQGHLVDAPLGK